LNCQICGGSGWIFTEKDGKRFAKKCKCTFKRASQKFFEESKIPRRYRSCKFSNYQPQTAYQLRALKVCREFFYLFPFASKGVLLYGPTGTGKTHLSVATLRNVTLYKGLRGVFCDFRNLLVELKTCIDLKLPTAELLDSVRKAPFLVLDDVGAERNTEWARDILAEIINYRYTQNLPTFITTNLTLGDYSADSFAAKFDRRTESRLYDMCKIVQVDGDDRRKEQKESSF
jgi:DNA replication protein DnaC